MCSIKTKDECGNTSLHEAAIFGPTETVSLLVFLGADINAKDSNGETALHKAALYGQTETVSLLVSLGADINARSYSGTAPLHKAALYGQTETVSLLVSLGAKINAKDCDGMTPLHFASRYGGKETTSRLISSGADVDAVDNYGNTSFMLALFCGHWDVVAVFGRQGECSVYEEELEWPVRECAGYLVIGCQAHRIGEWRAFSDDRISRMHMDALPFWREHGSAILAWADR